MRIQNTVLILLLVSLYGCQPEAPPPKAVAPAAMEPSAPPAPAVQAASQAEATAPVQPVEIKPVEKTVQPVIREKVAAKAKEIAPQPEATEKPAQPVTVQPAATPDTKAEPPAAAAEAKPEPAASEEEVMQLAKKSNCLACHAIDKKVVGPAWKDVAAKYRGDTAAETRLMEKIAKGGSGVWGGMVMPPTPQISEAQRRMLAKFILSLK